MPGRPMNLIRAQVALAAYQEPEETRSDAELLADLIGDLMHLADALTAYDEPDDPLGNTWPHDPVGTRHGLMAAQEASENYHFEVIGDGDYPIDDRGYQLAEGRLDIVGLAAQFRGHETEWHQRHPYGASDLTTDAEHDRYATDRADLYETLVDLGHKIAAELLGLNEVL